MDTDISAKKTALPPLGEHIKKIRQEKGLTQERLAGNEFTKGYVSALERGAVRPSLKALDVFARRLGVPITDFLATSTSHDLTHERSVEAQQEDFLYQCNYAKMLMRAGKVNEALDLVQEIESAAEAYAEALPPGLAYLPSFLRGRAYLQESAPKQARPQLEKALTTAEGDEEATARVRNLLGVAYFQLDLPQLAVEQHLESARSITGEVIKDPNFIVSVYRNLANDYWALNEPGRAISVYEEILPILNDLNDLEEQARVFWGMAMAYEKVNDRAHARLYGLRALHIYEAADNGVEAACIGLNLAEALTRDARYEEATGLLERAAHFASGTGNRAVMSYLYRANANLARREGRLEEAAQHAGESVRLGEAIFQAARGEEGVGQGGASLVWQDPARTYADALQAAALVAEAQGRKEDSDELFQQALALLETGGFEETRHSINFSYAEVLSARGEFERAMQHYRAAAQFQPGLGRHSS